MSHAFHGIDYDMHRDGLADGCPRCRYQAQHPVETLDTRMLDALRYRIKNALPARSSAEKLAMLTYMQTLMPVVVVAS